MIHLRKLLKSLLFGGNLWYIAYIGEWWRILEKKMTNKLFRLMHFHRNVQSFEKANTTSFILESRAKIMISSFMCFFVEIISKVAYGFANMPTVCSLNCFYANPLLISNWKLVSLKNKLTFTKNKLSKYIFH